MKKALVNTLKDRIRIVDEVRLQSSSGAPSSEISDVIKFNVRAQQKEVAVNEDDADGKIRALFTTAFIVRYHKGLTKGKANNYVVIDNEDYRYNIVQVVPKVDKKYLQINTIRRE